MRKLTRLISSSKIKYWESSQEKKIEEKILRELTASGRAILTPTANALSPTAKSLILERAHPREKNERELIQEKREKREPTHEKIELNKLGSSKKEYWESSPLAVAPS